MAITRLGDLAHREMIDAKKSIEVKTTQVVPVVPRGPWRSNGSVVGKLSPTGIFSEVICKAQGDEIADYLALCSPERMEALYKKAEALADLGDAVRAFLKQANAIGEDGAHLPVELLPFLTRMEELVS